MTARFAAALLVPSLLLGPLHVARAHHSVAGEFNINKTLTLSGVISKVDWMNPHLYIQLDVKGPDGKVIPWRLEGVPIAMARKAGLSKAMLVGHGEPVKILAFPARDGTKQLGFMSRITYPDGHFFQFAAEAGRKPS